MIPDEHERLGALYDAYLEAVLAGDAPDPEAFLREHDVEDPPLLDRLRALRSASGGGEAADAEALPFTRLGPYRVLRRIQAGGMGMVYLGMEDRLGRLVALKVLHPALQGEATQAARFEREAQIVARLSHPNIVKILGVGEEAGIRYLAMEYVEGEGLDQAIARAKRDGTPLPVATCVRFAIQIAGALQASHAAGVVHRDVKPSNVRIDTDGNAILLDFGIAAEEGTSRLTKTGRFLGTSDYAAPEQLRPAKHAEPDSRTDVYSLGVVLHEALAGAHPFPGTSEAETIRKILAGDPPALRRRRRDVPRDLQTVVRKAMERAPARRYATAAAFAEDLRAVLAIRPIRARRAGPFRRAAKFARRHPLPTAVLLLAGLAIAGVFAAQHVRQEREAARALAAARAGVKRFRELAAASLAAEQEYASLDERLETRWFSPAEETRYEEAEELVRRSRRDREATFYDVLANLRRAERLAPGVEGTDPIRAALYLERVRAARAAHDDDAAAFYRQLALRHASPGVVAEALTGRARLVVECATPGATARVFRSAFLAALVPDGEPRLVPVPLGHDTPVPPGAWAFRLVADHGALRAGDLVVRVDGEAPEDGNWRRLRDRLVAGAPVEAIARSGRVRIEVPPGADIRPTTQPLPWTEGPEALDPGGIDVPAGRLLVVIRARGHEELRVPLVAGPGSAARVECELLPFGTTPSGFVRIRTGPSGKTAPFWIQEREVTAAEYLEFLNDPETLAAIDSSERPIRYPRSPNTVDAGGHWPRGESGRYALPATWPRDWPALGVSFEDAAAYARWWTRRARERGVSFVASLPFREQWVAAASGGDGRLFVFGNRFRPRWTSSCYSRPEPGPAPVGSHPRDESPSGVFDLAGSAMEWNLDWWDEGAGLRRLAGGSWARAPREFFRVWSGMGSPPDQASDEFGFRLVLTRERER